MQFLSFRYLLFLPAAFVLYWAIPARGRWVVLAAASIWFYASWKPVFLVVLAAATLVSYFAGLLLEGGKDAARRRRGLAFGAVFILLGLLVFYKYAAFALGLAARFLQPFALPIHPVALRIVQPIGISFFTFQAVAYVLDVYRGAIRAERHFGRYSAFLLFFPKLLSGPIERGGSLLPQLATPRPFSEAQAVHGVKQIALGVFKKAVIADALAPFVAIAFDGSAAGVNGMARVLGAVFFTIQIYCDFSGYSDFAIGSADLFGIRLTDNFRSPYFSQSLQEFWSRWHLSLSTWFRDYVYIPLGGNRRGAWRTRWNLLATFALSGLWHGANLTFVAWGCLHGLAQIVEKAVGFSAKGKQRRAKAEPPRTLGAFLRVLLTMAVITVAWVFFRASSISGAFAYLADAATAWKAPAAGLRAAAKTLGLQSFDFVRLLLPVALLAIWDYVGMTRDLISETRRLPIWGRWLAYAAALAFTLFLLLPQGAASQNFIYFQF